MPIPAAVTDVLVRLLNTAAQHLGERLKQALGSKSSNAPILLDRVKSDPRYLEAQIEYLKRKQARERELLSLSTAKVDRRIQLQEQELEDRGELSLFQRQLLREWQTQTIQRQLNEISMLWDKDAWFSKLSLSDTEQILQRQQHRVLLLVAPPRMSQDCPNSFHHNLPLELRKIGEFLNVYYPIYQELHPVEFYSDYFKEAISDLDVRRLQPILAFVPTAIIYSDISDYEVNLRVGFWAWQNQQVLLPTLAWNWEKVQEELEASGYSQKESLRTIREAIVAIHKLLAAFFADAYYLYIDPHYEPQLFELESELDPEWINPYIKVLKEIQQRQREIYQQELKKISLIEAERTEEAALKQKAEKWKCVHTLAGHDNWVCAIAISPDGQMLASGSSDNDVKLWNLPTGQEICTFKGHLERVDAVSFSLDGKTLASSSSDNCVKLWNLRTQTEICTITGNISRVFPIMISPDRKAADGKNQDQTIKLWDLTMGQEIRPFNGNLNRGFPPVLSPDGETIAGNADDNAIALWNLHTGQEIRTLLGHSRWVNAVAFSGDGEMLATASVDETIKLWDWRAGTEICTFLGHSHWVNSITFSPDGKMLASGSMDRTIKLWNLKTGQEIRTMTGHAGGAIAVTFSPDGTTLVSGSTDGIIKIWRID